MHHCTLTFDDNMLSDMLRRKRGNTEQLEMRHKECVHSMLAQQEAQQFGEGGSGGGGDSGES